MFLFLPRIVKLSGRQIDNFDDFELLIGAPDYLQKVEKLLQSESFQAQFLPLLSAQSTRTVHNYMLWRMVFSKAPYLNSDFNLMVEKITTGVLRNFQTMPRWKFCLKQVTAHLPHAIGYMYIQEAFPKEAKERLHFESFRIPSNQLESKPQSK